MEEAASFRVGDVVRVVGLVSAPQFNQRCGRVVALFPEDGCVGVELFHSDGGASAKTLRVRLVNLQHARVATDTPGATMDYMEGSLHSFQPAVVVPPGASSYLNRESESIAREPGQTGSPYVFDRCLGEGAFGKTHLSHHSSRPSHPLVIKVSHPHVDAQCLRREAALLCSLHHPRIVRFRECVHLPGDRYFLVMEYAAGGSLAGKLAESPTRLTVLEVSRVLLHVLEALDYIHKSGVLHLDVK